MKNKYYITLILSLFFVLFASAQNKYYYYNGKKIYLETDYSKISVVSNTISVNFSSFQILIDTIKSGESIGKSNFIENLNNYAIPNNFYFEIKVNDNVKNNTVSYYNLINSISQLQGVVKATPNYKINGKELGITNYFYVKTINNLQGLYNLADTYNLEVIGKYKYSSNWYIVSCSKNNPYSSLEYANIFYESGFFEAAEPEFIYHNLLASNDPFYYDQWNMNNTGQNGGTNGIDINVEDAWNITKGNNVHIAIYDHGFEMNHPDLINNVYGNGYDANSGTSPALVRGSHGTACAGIIGAESNNNRGITGIAPETEIVSISINLQFSDTPLQLASGFDWAWNNNVDVISNSWGGYAPSNIITDAIERALNNGRNGKGCIIVFAAGNENNTNIRYPGNSIPNILVIGAMSPCGERKNPSSCDGETNWGSCYGNELDVVAPGVLIPTTDRQGNNGYNPNFENDPNYSNLDYYSRFNGTSSAAPHVAGVAGLILSVNPCLNVEQVNDIIEQTAQKVRTDLYSYTNQNGRPNGTWNEEMGYGLVDAYAAVQLAQQMNSSTLDLYVKDRPDDMGIEPNPTPDNMWISQDIWVRNIDDNGLTYQNPEYNANGNPNYIYVRVINKSCVASTGNETLTINWAKANTALAWPDNWDGSIINPNGYPLGGVLPTATIPVLQPGAETIVKIPWPVPNPDNYNTGQGSDNPWHFCLLAQINDGNPVTMTTNPNVMVRNENNLAWKNVTVVDLVTNITTASVMIANPTNNTKTYYLELIKDNNENGKAVYEEAEVTLKMDETLYNAWERGGKIAQEVEAKQDEKEKLVKGNNVLLDNINFNANEMGLLTLDFKFLTEQVTDKEEFIYHVIQKDTQTGEIIGGETFVIRKKQRPLFVANAGDDKEVDLNETVTITAEDINEVAEYNWYDSEGNLIYQGKDLSVSADISKKYKLEVVTTDGFKDYDEVEVKLRPGYIQTISPNPSSNSINVDYKLNGATSAYLMVIGVNNGSSNNYILDTSTSSITIDISSYQTGYYTVAIVCDGQITDAKQLLKQ